MAKEDIQLKISAAVESAEAAKSLGQLRKSLMEIQNLQSEMGDTSGPNFDKLTQAANAASAKLAETRDRIGDIVDKNRTLEGTPVERLTGSFGLLKQSIMTLDFDKAKIGAEGLINSFTPVVDGKLVTGFAGIKGALGGVMEGVKTLGSTFLSVGKALLTNPIFLLAAAITLIVIGIIKLLDMLGLLKPILDAIKAVVGAVVDAFHALTDALGLTSYAQQEAADEAIKTGEKIRKEADANAAKQQAVLSIIEGLTNEEIALLEKKLGYYISANQSKYDIEAERLAQAKATNDYELYTLQEVMYAEGEFTEEQQKQYDERLNNITVLNDKIKLNEEAKQRYLLDLETKATTTLRDLKIRNIKDANQRSLVEDETKKKDELRNIQVQQDVLARAGKKETQAYKDLTAAKLEIETYYTTRKRDVEVAIAKKSADDFKAGQDKKAKLLNEQLLKIEQGYNLELSLLKASLANKGISQKDFDAEEVATLAAKENAISEFKAKVDAKGIANYTKMGMTKVQFETQQADLIVAQAKRAEDLKNGIAAETGERLKTADALRLANAEKELKDYFDKSDTKSRTDDFWQAEYDKKQEIIFNLRKKQIADIADIEIQTGKKTDDEIALISQKAYDEIQKLDEEHTAFLLEQDALKKQTVSSAADYEVVKQVNKNANLRALYGKLAEDEIKLIEDSSAKKKSMLDANLASDLFAVSDDVAKRSAIEEQYRQDKEALEKESADRIGEIKREAAAKDLQFLNDGLQAASSVFNDITAAKKSSMDNQNKIELKGLTLGTKAYNDAKLRQFTAEQDFAKKSFNTNKGLQLGIATITGIQSVLSAFANGMKNPVPLLGPATAAIYAVTAGIVAAANIAKIAASKFGEGTPPTDTVPANQDASRAADMAAAAPTNFQPNQFFGLGQQTAAGMPGGPKPIKVYVSEGDIREVSERVSVIETRAVY